jgi:hypothetical protein
MRLPPNRGIEIKAIPTPKSMSLDTPLDTDAACVRIMAQDKPIETLQKQNKKKNLAKRDMFILALRQKPVRQNVPA